MVWYETVAMMLGAIVVLMGLGLPVAFAFLAANIVGAYVFMDGLLGLSQLVDNATFQVSRFTLVPVPLFLLMGELFFHSGLASRAFDALDACFGRIPGRLCYLTVAGGTSFSMLTGSSMANTAMLGSLMVPEMMRRGYKPRMAMGPILGSCREAYMGWAGRLARHRYGQCLQSEAQPIVIQLMNDRCGGTIGCIFGFGLQADHDAVAFVMLPHIDWHMAAEVVNAPLQIQVALTNFVYLFVYPYGAHHKKRMHANVLDWMRG